MKKSISAPNLQHVKPPQPKPMRKSISTQAFPINMPFFETASEIIQQEFQEMQAEAVLRVPGSQVLYCALNHHKFPSEIFNKEFVSGSTTPKTSLKDIIECWMEPCDKTDDVQVPNVRNMNTMRYLEMSESNQFLSERYMNLLRRIRRLRLQKLAPTPTPTPTPT